jgi:penicillin amidase
MPSRGRDDVRQSEDDHAGRQREGSPMRPPCGLWPLIQGGDVLPWLGRVQEATLALVRGSNSAAVSARSRRGAGLIAFDPHLALTLALLWLVAGLHAPGLDVVELMLPGLPLVALGRNNWLAWGGTSLHVQAAGWSMCRRSR